MANVRLSDVVIPAVYMSYTAVNSPETTVFWESGIVARNALFDERANGPSNITTMPFWNDLDATILPNLSTDNPADVAVPNKIGTGTMVARVAYLNQAYASADLVKELAGVNPMEQIRNRFGVYWQRQFQRRLLATAAGIKAHNVATDASDMGVAINTVTGTGTFTRNGFVNALYTMGDQVQDLTVIAVHSLVMKQMVVNDDIDFIPDSEGKATIPMFMGKRVVVDDSLPAVATTGALGTMVFTSYLFGGACFGYGDGTPLVPMEVDRKPEQGNGGGIESIWERKTWLLHPIGHSWTGTPAGQSATNTELATAANWTRVVPRKNIPFAWVTSTLTNLT